MGAAHNFADLHNPLKAATVAAFLMSVIFFSIFCKNFADLYMMCIFVLTNNKNTMKLPTINEALIIKMLPSTDSCERLNLHPDYRVIRDLLYYSNNYKCMQEVDRYLLELIYKRDKNETKRTA